MRLKDLKNDKFFYIVYVKDSGITGGVRREVGDIVSRHKTLRRAERAARGSRIVAIGHVWELLSL